MIRILLVDDFALLRYGLKIACEKSGRIQVVAQADNGRQAVDVVRRDPPDVVLMDIRMPEMDGVQAASIILSEFPDVKVILLTMLETVDYAALALQVGVHGYLLKGQTDDEVLVNSIQMVYQGGVVISPELLPRLLRQSEKINAQQHGERDSTQELTLTIMDVDILRHLARGESNAEIGEALGISEKSVSNRLTSLYKKLNVSNRVQASLYAIQRRLV